MAGTIYQVKTYGATLVARKLRRLADRASDLSPAWPLVAERAAAGFENAFRREGPGWPPLRPSTARRRIAEGYPGQGPILTKTRTLRSSLTTDIRWRGTASTFTVITPVKYGKYHMTGTSRMPARPITLSKWYQRQMSAAIGEVLDSAYNG